MGGFMPGCHRWSRAFSLAALAFALALAAGVNPVLAQCGTRWVTKTGLDAGNTCLSSSSPCRSINYAISQACANDGIEVGEGTWFDPVLINKAVYVNSTGNNANTILRGNGTTDIVRILSSGATLNGFAVTGPNVGYACVRIGDTSHPGLRTIQLSNLNVSGCPTGVIVDSIGATGDWVRINGNIISNHVADGSENGGVGVLLTGGVGRIEIRQDTMENNGGPAIKILAGTNGTTEIAGDIIRNNGLAASAQGRAAIEAHMATDLRIEGNLFTGQTGLTGLDDGRGVWIDGANIVEFFCNEMHDNDGGLKLTGTVTEFDGRQNRFYNQTGPAVEVGTGSAAGVALNETMIYGNGQGVVNTDVAAVNVQHSWWGNASGPTGGGGTGDSISGLVDVTNFIARTLQPVLARAPKTSGWSRSTAACYNTLQSAIDAAPATSLVLIGAGEIQGHVTLTKALDLEGVPYEVPLSYCDHCYASVINGTQSGATRTPAMTISGVSGISVRYLTFHGAGMGTPACWAGHEDTEIGLDLDNVDNSLFEYLDFRENGTTEMRVRGDSDGNTFSHFYMDGMIRDGDNEDRCGHRSREGLLIDGGLRTCESGPGAWADNNHIEAIQTYHITRSVKLRYANGTEIANSTIHGVPSDEWPETDAINIWIEASSDTNIHDNPQIANRGVHKAIAILGSRSCETVHSARTLISNTTLDMIENSGIGIHLIHEAGDNGAPVDTQVTCSTIQGAHKGMVVDWVDGNEVSLTDFVSDTSGIINNTTETFSATANWWGHASGPSGAGPGSGTSVSAYVGYANWLSSSARDDADSDGVTECQGDLDDANAMIHPGDGCDAFDNDLDGTVDEDFSSTPTSCGFGLCASTGVTSCIGGVIEDSCQPLTPEYTTDPTCDLVDEDCDGSTDEDYPGTPSTCGLGACYRTGYVTCVNGSIQDTCEPGAPISPDDATCDNVDDNCNGQTDEDFAAGPSSCGLGVCASTGVTSCTNGIPGDSCVPNPPLSPTDTTCDNVDDDCDGLIDDEFTSEPTSCGLGVCARSGATSCVGGVQVDSCTPGSPNTPDDPSCNGQDDDCDGSVDEDYTVSPVVCGKGVCAVVGTITCENGHAVEHCTPGTPGEETCNGLDDDCDGTVDNNIPLPVGPALVSAVRTSGRSTQISWPVVPHALTYDLLRGTSLLLVQSGGDYSVATGSCIVNNFDGTSWLDKDTPATGDGFWFLVRAMNCVGNSSYDAGENGLAAPRDAGIAASPNACP